LFLNVVAGLSLAPFIYWDAILMRVVLASAHEDAILLGLNTLNALGGAVLLLLAAPVLGGCMSVMRKILAGTDGFLPGELRRGIAASVRTSLLAGAIIGFSLGAMRVGLVSLATQLPAGPLRAVLTAILVLQFMAALPLCLLTLAQSNATQRHPLQAFAHAGKIFATQPLRYYGLLAVTALPVLVLFLLPQPVMTLLGFLFVQLFALAPMMLAWQKSNSGGSTQHASTKKTGPTTAVTMLLFTALTSAALAVPFLWQGQPASTMREALTFLARQALLEADNGAFRNLLSASGVWPLLVAALLGSACCILVSYVCACYRFRLRKLVFAVVVLLQLLPMLSRYAALEQLLRNLNLNFPSVALGLIWALLYILVAWLLFRHFARMLPALERNRSLYPGARLFFYYALPRARLYVLALTTLATLGAWGDALAPFWHIRELGAFSLTQFIWESLPTLAERLSYVFIILAAFLLFVILVMGAGRRKKAK